MRIIAAFLSILLSQILAAQMLPCGTQLKPGESKAMRTAISRSAYRMHTDVEQEVKLGISAHIITRDDGSGGLSVNDLQDELELVNSLYSASGISFFLLHTEQINSTYHYNLNEDDVNELAQEHDTKNTINIYFANTVSSNFGVQLCGYADMPPGENDRIVLDKTCAVNGSTLAHELGHYFSLLHTHGKYNSILTDELVDGTNCAEAGDEICDTPADPQLGYHNVNNACVYLGNYTDAKGNFFNPDPTNIMSYSVKECRENFSQGQYERARTGYETFRKYLHTKSILADIIASTREVCIGGTIEFTNRSIGASNVVWFFEGGEPGRPMGKSIEVSYAESGSYDVKLIASNGSESDTLYLKDYVLVTPGVVTSEVETSTSFEVDPPIERTINADEKITFMRTTQASTSGSASIFMNFFDYSQKGEVDYLLLSPVKRSVAEMELSFDYAYAPYSSSFYDELAIVYRGVCDQVWQTIWQASGSKLATVKPRESRFIPTSSEWKREEISFIVPDSLDYFEVAFKATNGYGNNLYIDNVQLHPKRLYKIYTKHISCEGMEDGRIAVVPDDPKSKYEYSLDGKKFSTDSVFTGLSAGIYTVSIWEKKKLLATSEVELLDAKPIQVNLQTDCNDVKENIHQELLDIYFGISKTPSSQGPWYLIEDDDTLYYGSSPYVDLPPGRHQVKVVDAISGCETSTSFDVTILDRLNVYTPEPAPGDEFASLYVKVDYRGPGDSIMYRLTGSSDWHQLSDTIRIAVESSGSVRVKNLSSAFEQCELWSYYRSTASGFITIDQQDGDCQFGAIRVSNTGPVVYDEENYPYEYSIDGLRFSEKASFDSLPAGKYKVFVHDNYGELDPELAYSYRVKDVLVDVQDSLEVATEIFCVGEQIEAVFTIHGSNGYEDDPWLYIVDDSLRSSDGVFSGLLPGHHIVEVKNLNSGCTTSAGFDVTVIDSVAAEVSNPTHEGVGGAVVPRVFSRGKTHNILFQVSNENYTSPWLSLTDTLRGLANGEYLLTVQNRIEGHYACEKSTSFTIKQVLPIDASVDATALRCHGELSEVNVEASGGNGSFLYRLDSGHYKADSYFQSVRGGNHIITVKDTDNSVTQVFFNIPEPDPISLEVAVTGPVCYEDLGYAKISASGGSGEYSFIFMGDTLSARSLQWIPIGGAESAFGTIPALVGKHQLTILDGAGCTSPVHFEVGYDESNETASLQVNGRVCYEFGEVHVGVQDKDDRTKYLLNQYPDEVEGRQCTDEAYFELKMLSPLQLQISAHDPVCSSDDGYAEVMVAGGTPPYKYQLSGNGFVSESVFQHLAEGEYELSVRDANGCEVTEGFYLNENPQEIQLETIVYEPRCPEEHGAVTISTDMKGALLYKINDRPYQSEGYFDDLKAGDYKVMVQSEYGCLLSDTFSITSTNATEFEVDVKDATCPENADGAIYMPSDLSYQTYYDGVLIRDGLKGLSAGTYMINYVDESGCNGVEEVVVGYQYEYPDIPIITSNEGWLEVMDSDYIVTWYRNGVPMSVGDDVHRIPAYPGAYQVSLAAGAGYCEVFSDVYDVPSTETRVADEIMVMPNPVISKLSVLLPENYQQQLRSVSVLDLSGQVLRTTSGMSMNLDLPGGIYLIRIQGEGFDVTRRFIKQ